ncbi:MAG: tetratricopeptide repeat protein [Acidobacteriota bacterium]|nr:tetratricopeptide repeat protein [Acidobacteriota bacterium]
MTRYRSMLAWLVILSLSGAGTAAAAQATGVVPPPPASPEQRQADAYYQFIIAQQLESSGDVDGAIAAYKRARELDPKSAEVPAQLAALYMRQSRLSDAIATAEEALKLDADNRDAHRVLGLVYAAIAQNDDANTAADTRRAIAELEKAQLPRDVLPDPETEITLGRLYVSTQQYEQAIPLLQRLVTDEPGWDAPVRVLAEAYVGAGQTKNAVGMLEEAARRNPALDLPLARLAEQSELWQQAADAYGRAVAQNPTSIPLRLRWVAALMNVPDRKGLPQAREILVKVLDESPADGGALYLLAQVERQMQAFNAAETTAKKLIALDANSLRGHYALVQVYEDRHDYRQVVEALQPFLTLLPPDVVSQQKPQYGLLLLHLAFAYEQLQQWDQALTAFEQARPYAPKDAAIDLYLSQVNLEAKRYAQALELAQKGRQAHPDDLRFLGLEAQALRHTGKFDQGVQLLQDAVKAHPGDVSLYLSLAQLYADGGQAGKGIALLQSAARQFPDETRIPFELGTIYDGQKKFKDAESALQQVLARDPQNAPALNYLGYMLADRGERLDESVGYIKRALAVDPNNGAYLDSLGWAYFKKNDLDRAEQNLSRAAAQLTTNSVVQDHYGQLLFKRGRYADAIAAWKRALAGDGESIDKHTIEDRIRKAEGKLGRR